MLKRIKDARDKAIAERKHFRFRLALIVTGMIVMFGLLVERLYELQLVNGEHYREIEQRSSHKATPIAPIRGNIYDIEGTPLAFNSPSSSLYFRIESDQKRDDVIQLAYKLEQLFRDYATPGHPVMTAPEIMKAMDTGYDLEKRPSTAPSYSFVPRRIRTGLNQAELGALQEQKEELKWLEVMEESVRTYDPTRTAVQLIGYLRPFARAKETRYGLDFYQDVMRTKNYMNDEDVGFDGLELLYQNELRGESGVKTYPVNAAQKIIGQVSIEPPKRGNNLFLTIHKDVQKATERAIIEQLAYAQSDAARDSLYGYAPNARAGYAVAMEVETGRVVAMASMPDYDPNVWTGGISNDNYQRIQPFINNGTITTAYPDYPAEELKNHPNSIVYMGSVVKPLSVLIGLNEGLIKPSSRYTDTGEFVFGKDNQSRLTNSGKVALGSIDPMDAIRLSSNTYMAAMIGNPLYLQYGQEAISKWEMYLAKFGLGITTGSDLPRESAGLSEFKTNEKETVQSRMVFASWGQMKK